MNEEYKNLTEDELVFADHFAEVGNFSALRELREVSDSRDTIPEKLVIDRRPRND